MDIQTPSPVSVSASGPDGQATGTFEFNGNFGSTYSERFLKAQKFIDSEVLRLCDPKVPKRNGILIASGIANTKIGTGMVTYRTPYARRWYYTNANFNGAPERGTKWFERMKRESGKDVLKGAAKILDGN